MSSCIYSLKILLLQGQLQVEETDLEKLRSFGDFVAIFFSSFWFQSPLASEAALASFSIICTPLASFALA